MASTARLTFNERCNAARPHFAKWCSVPPPADAFERQRWFMCGAHLVILESFQNVYNLADTIVPGNEQTFAKYVFFSLQGIGHHIRMEQTIYYPGLRPEFQTPVLDEHDAFSKALETLDVYVKGVLGGKQGAKDGELVLIPGVVKQKYDGKKIQALFDDLAEPLITHLEHEIEWLAPEKIRASGITQQRLVELEGRRDDSFRNEMSLSLLVLALGNKPPYSHFPPAPWFIRKILVPWVFYWKDRREWRFLPNTFVNL